MTKPKTTKRTNLTSTPSSVAKRATQLKETNSDKLRRLREKADELIRAELEAIRKP